MSLVRSPARRTRIWRLLFLGSAVLICLSYKFFVTGVEWVGRGSLARHSGPILLFRGGRITGGRLSCTSLLYLLFAAALGLG
jgi:hypothetical protein